MTYERAIESLNTLLWEVLTPEVTEALYRGMRSQEEDQSDVEEVATRWGLHQEILTEYLTHCVRRDTVQQAAFMRAHIDWDV